MSIATRAWEAVGTDEPVEDEPRAEATGGAGSLLFVPCLIFATGCTYLMWLLPGQETVPYHLAWIAIALCYGLEAWPWPRTLLTCAGYTTATGLILLARATEGVVAWEELTEIPLMTILFLLVARNTRFRFEAYAALSRIRRRERAQAAQREQLSRMSSHEMRTPATIAIGYVEILLAQEPDEDRRGDLVTVREELGRLVTAADRMVRTLRVQDQNDVRVHDLQVLLRETLDRWSALAVRDWQLDCPSIRQACSAERVRAAVDTLVENALRYTEDGDTIRLVGAHRGDEVFVGVADSGPGLPPEMVEALNGTDPAAAGGAYTTVDPKAQTGLGLALVRTIATNRGGRLVAGVSEEGGALVGMLAPRLLGARRWVPPDVPMPAETAVAAPPSRVAEALRRPRRAARG